MATTITAAIGHRFATTLDCVDVTFIGDDGGTVTEFTTKVHTMSRTDSATTPPATAPTTYANCAART
ncbi:MAG: hypothetical protein ACRDQY_20820 [Pseudonocardiaceae bacterium]